LASSRWTSRSCSSLSSIDALQRQQSATISQMRIVIGARQSGQAQRIEFPCSQISPAERACCRGRAAGRAAAAGWSNFVGKTVSSAGPSLISGSGSSPSRSNVGTGGAGLVGSGRSCPVGTSSGRKSKPISLGPKLWASSES
jgi:hypothetical protein